MLLHLSLDFRPASSEGGRGELCSSNRWKKCCHRTSGFDSEFPQLLKDRHKPMLFACSRYQFPTCSPSHARYNLYTEELHVEKHYEEKKSTSFCCRHQQAISEKSGLSHRQVFDPDAPDHPGHRSTGSKARR